MDPSEIVCSGQGQTCQGILNFDYGEVKCSTCETDYCKRCRLKKHEGVSCEDGYGKNFKEWKACPDCHLMPEKTQPHNKMSCTCGHDYCFICGMTWKDSHYKCQE